MSGGRGPRQKGDRAERLVVSLLQAAGFAAERTLKAGATRGRGGTYDVTTPLLGADRKIEVKCGAGRYGTVYAHLGANFALVVKADRKDPLLVLRLSDAIDIAALAEKSKGP
jgi:hypothetical protein